MPICRYNYPVCISVNVIAYMYKLGVQLHLHFKHAYIRLNSRKIKLRILNLTFMRDIIDLIKTWRIKVMESTWKFPLLCLQVFVGLKKHSLIIFTCVKIIFTFVKQTSVLFHFIQTNIIFHAISQRELWSELTLWVPLSGSCSYHSHMPFYLDLRYKHLCSRTSLPLV